MLLCTQAWLQQIRCFCKRKPTCNERLVLPRCSIRRHGASGRLLTARAGWYAISHTLTRTPVNGRHSQIYAVYSSLLLTLMGKQLLYVDTITSDWTTQAMTQAGQDSESDATTRRSLTERTSEVLKRTSGVTKDLFRRASHGSDMRVLSKRDLLKRNARLIWLEFFSFSFFTLCWW